MRAARGAAPGKVILFGEHAVVYGRPALAVPVDQVQATATVTPGGDGFWIEAADLRRRYPLAGARANDPLAKAVRQVLRRGGLSETPAGWLRVESTIPIASGMGSGAAVCTAVVRAMAGALEIELSAAEVSALVFETETLLHGTPSGIDNTVVAFEQPVYFVRGQPPAPLRVGKPFRLLIADTGKPSPTRVTVGEVRAAHEREPARLAGLFDQIGAVVDEARQRIETGQPEGLGVLMNRNQALLRELRVSSPELEALIAHALEAGALGAKLSGGGRGGNMLTLVAQEGEGAVRAALEAGGAMRVTGTTVGE
jgi:mevalonate kinase